MSKKGQGIEKIKVTITSVNQVRVSECPISTD